MVDTESKANEPELTIAERRALELAKREADRMASNWALIRVRLDELESIENRRGVASNATTRTFNAPQRAAYLLGIETHGGQAKAAQAAGITRSTVIAYAVRVPEYATAEREALELYRDGIADEVRRRAVEGVLELRFDRNGLPAGETRTYSDGLLSKILDRADRRIGDLPAENAQGSIGNIDAAMVRKLSPEGRRALRLVLTELAGLLPTPEERAEMQLESIPPAIDVQAREVASDAQ